MGSADWKAGDRCEAVRAIWLAGPRVDIERGSVGTVRYVDPETHAVVVEWPIGHFVRFTPAESDLHLRRLPPAPARK